jgi:3-oxoadipate enol-lactonase
MLGFAAIGYGPSKVMMVHDWLGDHTNYAPIHPYLDQADFTWVFPDLRGYGASRDLDGFSLEQATADLIDLADRIGLAEFAIAGHSMSGMIALRLAIDWPKRIRKIVLTSPAPPGGLELDAAARAFFESVPGDRKACREVIGALSGGRYGAAWLDYKVRRAQETSTEAARLGYLVDMLLGGGFEKDLVKLAAPVLVVTGEHDADGFREADQRAKLAAVSAKCRFECIHEAGHYAMQEAPVRFASLIQEFLS